MGINLQLKVGSHLHEMNAEIMLRLFSLEKLDIHMGIDFSSFTGCVGNQELKYLLQLLEQVSF